MEEQHLDRGAILTEALPYLQRYNGKVVVVHCGPEVMDDPELRQMVASDLVMLPLVGISMVVVHHGGENHSLVATLNELGGLAVGLCGVDGGLLKLEEGETPQLAAVNPLMVQHMLQKGYTPVIQALGQTGGRIDPLEGDLVAARLAVALQAEKLIHLLRRDQMLWEEEGGETPIPLLKLSHIPAMIRSGVIPQELTQLVNRSVEAVRSGVSSATILDGAIPHAILLELLSDAGMGTMLTYGG